MLVLGRVPSAFHQTNMAKENGPEMKMFLSSIKHGDIPASYVSLPEGHD